MPGVFLVLRVLSVVGVTVSCPHPHTIQFTYCLFGLLMVLWSLDTFNLFFVPSAMLFGETFPLTSST